MKSIIKIFIVTIASVHFLGSCSSSEFASSSQSSVDRDCKKNPASCDKNGGGGGSTSIDGDTRQRDLQKNEAVLAVRDLSCAFCHTQVASNVISDFGISTGEASAEQTLRKLMYQTNYSTGQQAQPTITGDFIVPKGDIPTIASTVNECVFSSEGIAAESPKQKRPLIDTLVKCAQPVFNWGVSSKKFTTRDIVSINPVSSPQDIIAIVGASKLNATGMALVGDSQVSGISGSKQSGFTAASTVSCEGAIVLDGPVVFKDSTINTVKGCRVYSTGSIFVFGNTNVTTTSDSSNLQLMSPLFIGFDISSADSASRFKYDQNSLLKLSRGTPAEVSSLMQADASKLGISNHQGHSNVSYRRVAASAPVVYSRNLGSFSGAIVAEHFIGKIGALSFTFDPVFKAGTTAIFPEIRRALVVSR